MPYIICPRCRFRVPQNKHMCTTCGFVIPSPETTRAVTDTLGPQPKTQRSGFWRKFLGLEQPDDDHKEPGAEEPALG